ncbi:hypothetical protein [Streptomyces sp. NPDC000410]|uniref:hypothetical protein n=1 Tax=Streptomyces sp. NPDC000410 TaxID=3154254 RepID=UPI0033269D55
MRRRFNASDLPLAHLGHRCSSARALRTVRVDNAPRGGVPDTNGSGSGDKRL